LNRTKLRRQKNPCLERLIKNVPELHDRIIVAIAKLCDAGLITKDGEIGDSKEVETKW
jgi:hypothetical protein